MSDWKIKTIKKVKLTNPVLIEGMPGIGNAGKIAADLIVDQLKARKIVSFFSESLPNSVFVREDNLVELPKIHFYHKRRNNKDFLFLVGDTQPMKNKDSYSFAWTVLSKAKEMGCKEIITLGGIGLSEPRKKPRVYCTGNDEALIKEFVRLGASNKLYGVVGPIMGITGLLLGLSREKDVRAASLLAETYAHPMHIGLRGAKEIMKLLDKKYSLGMNLNKMEKDIKKIEDELKNAFKQHQELLEQSRIENMRAEDTTYIG